MTFTSLLFLPISWIVTAAGRTLCEWLRLPQTATQLERNLIGYGLGLGLLAYGMLALGLLGLLYPVVGLCWVLALALLGGRQHKTMAHELRVWRPGRLHWWGWLAAAVFAYFALVALAGVGSPPTLLEWDSLSYHLAVPKLYLQAHRIYYIPWLLHSNFAFLAEMWYTIGLMINSVPLAKCFHFACAVGTCLAVYALGARHLTSRVGLAAALLLAGTPVFFWEAGTAYVDVAVAFFVTLTLLAVANGVAVRDECWLRVGAVLMGLTLSTKATGFLTLALLIVALLVWRTWRLKQPIGRVLGAIALWVGLALLIGSPWYLKSLAYTGNPVYPFVSKLFGGRYWTPASTAAYEASNNPGIGRNPHSLAEALLLPWNLTMYLMPGHPTASPQPFNEFASSLFAVPPLLLAALFFPTFTRRPALPAVRILAAYALGALLMWFATTQFVRFLIPTLPLLCLLAAWTTVQAVRARGLSSYALGGVVACSLLWSLSIGAQLLASEAPVALGRESPDAYLSAHDTGYDAMRFINTQLPPTAKLIFYGHPLGFDCDRSYLWANLYVTYLPTQRFHSPEDLRHDLRARGVTDILIDPTYFPIRPGNDELGWVYALTVAHGPPVYADRHILIYALPSG